MCWLHLNPSLKAVCVCVCACEKREESKKEALFVHVDERGGNAGASAFRLCQKMEEFLSPAPYCLCQSSFFWGWRREGTTMAQAGEQDTMQMNTFTVARSRGENRVPAAYYYKAL